MRSLADWHAHYRRRHPLTLRQRVKRRSPINGDELARLYPALLAAVLMGLLAGHCTVDYLFP